jgi:hypothetical protein
MSAQSQLFDLFLAGADIPLLDKLTVPEVWHEYQEWVRLVRDLPAYAALVQAADDEAADLLTAAGVLTLTWTLSLADGKPRKIWLRRDAPAAYTIESN